MEVYVAIIISFIVLSMVILRCDFFGFLQKLSNFYLSVIDYIVVDEDGYLNGLKKYFSKMAAYLTAVVFMVFLASLVISAIWPYFNSYDENKFFGPVGDLFNGVVTPVLTFLTFCGLLLTILMQNVQMKATLKELNLTRNEAQKSNLAMEKQVANSEVQQINNFFFSLLEYQKKVIQDIEERPYEASFVFNGENLTSRIFTVYYEHFVSVYTHISFYEADWVKNKDNLLPFFLLNYNILNWIDENVALRSDNVNDENYKKAKGYTNILRATFSKELLFMLFVNVGCGDFEDYKKLIVKYAIFEHIDLSEVHPIVFLYLFNKLDQDAFGDKVRLFKYIDKYWRDSLELSISVSDQIFSDYRSNTKSKIVLGGKKLHRFVREKYSHDDIKNNLKLLQTKNIHDFLEAKGFNINDVINFDDEEKC